MECERCSTLPRRGYSLHDYCDLCSKNLCFACMQKGCCGNKPALSGMFGDQKPKEEEPK